MLDQLQEALDGLTALVDRVTQGDYSDDEELRAEMLRWEEEDARGSGGLGELAISALEYQLAEQGVRGSMEEAAVEMRALQRLKAALFPAEEPRPVEVAPAPAYRERFPTARAFRIGSVQILAAEEAGGWHVSVSHPERFPTWEELRAAAGVASGVSAMWVYVPLDGEPGAIASNVIHLFETPPVEG
jgi:hypothetical protein